MCPTHEIKISRIKNCARRIYLAHFTNSNTLRARSPTMGYLRGFCIAQKTFSAKDMLLTRLCVIFCFKGVWNDLVLAVDSIPSLIEACSLKIITERKQETLWKKRNANFNFLNVSDQNKSSIRHLSWEIHLKHVPSNLRFNQSDAFRTTCPYLCHAGRWSLSNF